MLPIALIKSCLDIIQKPFSSKDDPKIKDLGPFFSANPNRATSPLLCIEDMHALWLGSHKEGSNHSKELKIDAINPKLNLKDNQASNSSIENSDELELMCKLLQSIYPKTKSNEENIITKTQKLLLTHGSSKKISQVLVFLLKKSEKESQYSQDKIYSNWLNQIEEYLNRITIPNGKVNIEFWQKYINQFDIDDRQGLEHFSISELLESKYKQIIDELNYLKLYESSIKFVDSLKEIEDFVKENYTKFDLEDEHLKKLKNLFDIILVNSEKINTADKKIKELFQVVGQAIFSKDLERNLINFSIEKIESIVFGSQKLMASKKRNTNDNNKDLKKNEECDLNELLVQLMNFEKKIIILKKDTERQINNNQDQDVMESQTILKDGLVNRYFKVHLHLVDLIINCSKTNSIYINYLHPKWLPSVITRLSGMVLKQDLGFKLFEEVELEAFYPLWKRMDKNDDNNLIPAVDIQFEHVKDMIEEEKQEEYRKYHIQKLSAQDPRCAIIGKLTDCCQYLGGAGSACAIHSITNSSSGIYALIRTDEKFDGKKTISSQVIVAQSWVFKAESGHFVFDNVECKKEYRYTKLVENYFKACVRQLKDTYFIEKINIGLKNNKCHISDMKIKSTDLPFPSEFSKEAHYDSKEQACIIDIEKPYTKYNLLTNKEMMMDIEQTIKYGDVNEEMYAEMEKDFDGVEYPAVYRYLSQVIKFVDINLVKILIEHNSIISKIDLKCAIKTGSIEILSFLENEYKNNAMAFPPKCIMYDENKFLTFGIKVALVYDKLEMFEHLLDRYIAITANKNDSLSIKNTLIKIISKVIKIGSLSSFQLMITKFENLSLQDLNKEISLVHQSIDTFNDDILEFLISQNVSLTEISKKYKNHSPLQKALENGNINALVLLRKCKYFNLTSEFEKIKDKLNYKCMDIDSIVFLVRQSLIFDISESFCKSKSVISFEDGPLSTFEEIISIEIKKQINKGFYTLEKFKEHNISLFNIIVKCVMNCSEKYTLINALISRNESLDSSQDPMGIGLYARVYIEDVGLFKKMREKNKNCVVSDSDLKTPIIMSKLLTENVSKYKRKLIDLDDVKLNDSLILILLKDKKYSLVSDLMDTHFKISEVVKIEAIYEFFINENRKLIIDEYMKFINLDFVSRVLSTNSDSNLRFFLEMLSKYSPSNMISIVDDLNQSIRTLISSERLWDCWSVLLEYKDYIDIKNVVNTYVKSGIAIPPSLVCFILKNDKKIRNLSQLDYSDWLDHIVEFVVNPNRKKSEQSIYENSDFSIMHLCISSKNIELYERLLSFDLDLGHMHNGISVIDYLLKKWFSNPEQYKGFIKATYPDNNIEQETIKESLKNFNLYNEFIKISKSKKKSSNVNINWNALCVLAVKNNDANLLKKIIEGDKSKEYKSLCHFTEKGINYTLISYALNIPNNKDLLSLLIAGQGADIEFLDLIKIFDAELENLLSGEQIRKYYQKLSRYSLDNASARIFSRLVRETDTIDDFELMGYDRKLIFNLLMVSLPLLDFSKKHSFEKIIKYIIKGNEKIPYKFMKIISENLNDSFLHVETIEKLMKFSIEIDDPILLEQIMCKYATAVSKKKEYNLIDFSSVLSEPSFFDIRDEMVLYCFEKRSSLNHVPNLLYREGLIRTIPEILSYVSLYEMDKRIIAMMNNDLEEIPSVVEKKEYLKKSLSIIFLEINKKKSQELIVEKELLSVRYNLIKTIIEKFTDFLPIMNEFLPFLSHEINLDLLKIILVLCDSKNLNYIESSLMEIVKQDNDQAVLLFMKKFNITLLFIENEKILEYMIESSHFRCLNLYVKSCMEIDNNSKIMYRLMHLLVKQIRNYIELNICPELINKACDIYAMHIKNISKKIVINDVYQIERVIHDIDVTVKKLEHSKMPGFIVLNLGYIRDMLSKKLLLNRHDIYILPLSSQKRDLKFTKNHSQSNQLDSGNQGIQTKANEDAGLESNIENSIFTFPTI